MTVEDIVEQLSIQGHVIVTDFSDSDDGVVVVDEDFRDGMMYVNRNKDNDYPSWYTDKEIEFMFSDPNDHALHIDIDSRE